MAPEAVRSATGGAVKKLTWHEAHAEHPATLAWLMVAVIRLRLRVGPRQGKLLEE